jgi:hypothetical protein
MESHSEMNWIWLFDGLAIDFVWRLFFFLKFLAKLLSGATNGRWIGKILRQEIAQSFLDGLSTLAKPGKTH